MWIHNSTGQSGLACIAGVSGIPGDVACPLADCSLLKLASHGNFEAAAPDGLSQHDTPALHSTVQCWLAMQNEAPSALHALKCPWVASSSSRHVDRLTIQGPDQRCTFEAWRLQSGASDAVGG